MNVVPYIMESSVLAIQNSCDNVHPYTDVSVVRHQHRAIPWPARFLARRSPGLVDGLDRRRNLASTTYFPKRKFLIFLLPHEVYA